MKNKEILHWISNSIRGKRHYLVSLSLIQVFLGLLSVGFAFCLKFITDALTKMDQSYFVISVVSMGGIVVLIFAFTCLYRFLYEYASTEIENSLRRRLYKELLLSPYSKVKSLHKEEWINRLTSDVNVVATNILSIVPILGRMSVQFIAAFALIIYISPQFGLILLPISVLLLLLTFLLRKRLRKYHSALMEEEGKYKVFLSESLGGLSIIHSFVKEDVANVLGDIRLASYKKAKIRRDGLSIICSLGFLVLYYGGYLFGILFCGFKILNGELDIPSLTSIVALLTEIQAPIGNLTSILPRYYALLGSAQRLIVNEEAHQVKEYTLEETNKKYDAFLGLEVKDLSFSYSSEKEVLSEINLSLNKGGHVALLGHSGIGKSTLFKLILSLYSPSEGQISMRFEDGDRKISEEDRNLFAYVPQEMLILKGSIRDNVAFFSKEIDEERLKEAYQLSCCEEFLISLEQGDLTLLNEAGGGLSIGQLQRLSLARALYSDKPILLLDEPFSSLDEATSRRIGENLSHLKGKTILCITHREDVLGKDFKVVRFEE